jgi:aminoglycoside 2'-N-acetyltransferase I
MPAIHTVHCAFLRPDQHTAVRELLDTAFGGGFSDEDWANTQGGLHTLVYDEDGLVAHGAVIQRQLLYEGRALRTGYVEGLAVRSAQRRRGYGYLVLDELERIVEGAYDIGALSDGTGIAEYYERRGWLRWQGPTAVLARSGATRTPDDDGGVLVRPTARTRAIDVTTELTCDWRDGDIW